MKRITSLILVIVIICLSVSPALAVEDENEPIPYTVNESVMAYYIWLMLSSWGISINTGTPGEYNTTIEDTIIDWVMTYLDEMPSAYTISTWIAPWQASMDYWGNFQGNASMLDDVNDFANWLVAYLTLTDNEDIVVDPIITVDGVQVYEFDTYYLADVQNGQTEIVYMEAEDWTGFSPLGWIVVHNIEQPNNAYAWCLIVVSYNGTQGSVNIAPRYYRSDGTWIDSDGGLIYRNGPNNNHLFWYGSYDGKYLRAIPSGGAYYEGTYNQFLTWINNAEIETLGDIKILTSTINLPVDDPDYTTGDSITIVGDDPQYTVINFPDNLKVSNLPAIISEGAVPDPGFGSIFAPVSALITAMIPAITIVQGIAFELPDILITFFLSMCGCMIFFGFVRKMIE